MKLILAALMLSLSVIGCGPGNQFTPDSSHPKNLDLFQDIMDFADILRSDDPEMESLLKDPTLTAVTREFGPSVIGVNQLPMRSGLVTASVKPWSSWWYPKKEDYVFKDSH